MAERVEPTPMRALLGDEVRRAREAAGLNQRQLAEKVFCKNTLISMLETGQRIGSEDTITLIDGALDRGGLLPRIWKRAGSEPSSSTLGDLMDYEAKAVAVREYHLTLVPGLLQTEAYMRALFTSLLPIRPDVHQIEESVAVRLARQEILTRGTPVQYTAILDENVISRVIGSRAVMREQLAHIRDLMSSRRATIQIMPTDAGTYPAAGGMIIIDTGSETIVHQDVAVGPGIMTSDLASVREVVTRYDLLRSQALRVSESMHIIERQIEELGT